MLPAPLSSMKPGAEQREGGRNDWAEAEAQVKFLPKEPTVFRAWPKGSGNQPAFLFDAIICGRYLQSWTKAQAERD